MIKKCVGAVIYDEGFRVLLIRSPKWTGYIIPGGKIEGSETPEEALIREINEELGITIRDIEFIGEKKKENVGDFFDKDIDFYFLDFFAKANSKIITTNDEISNWGWFGKKEIEKLDLVDSTRDLLNKFFREKDI